MAHLASILDVAWLCVQTSAVMLALLAVATPVAIMYLYLKLEPDDRMMFHAPLKYGLRLFVNWFFEPETVTLNAPGTYVVGLDYEEYKYNRLTRTLILYNLKLPSEGYVARELHIKLAFGACSLTIHDFAMPNPKPPVGLTAWKDPNLLHIGHVHLDFGGLVGLLSNCLPLYESADDSWVMGPVMSRVTALSISDVTMHIEEVYAPHGYWPAKYACADHVEFGWERTSNLSLLTGAATLEGWAKEEQREERQARKVAALLARRRKRLNASTDLTPVAAATIIQKNVRAWLQRTEAERVRKKMRKSSPSSSRMMSVSAHSPSMADMKTAATKTAQSAMNMTKKAADAVESKAVAAAKQAHIPPLPGHREPAPEPIRKEFHRTIDQPLVPILLINALSITQVKVGIYKTKLAKGSFLEAVKGYHFGDLTRKELHSLLYSAVNGLAVLPRFSLTDLHAADWPSCIKKAGLAILKTLMHQVTDKYTRPIAACAVQAAVRRKQASKAVHRASVNAREKAAAIMVQANVRRHQTTTALRSKSLSPRALSAKSTGSASKKSSMLSRHSMLPSRKSMPAISIRRLTVRSSSGSSVDSSGALRQSPSPASPPPSPATSLASPKPTPSPVNRAESDP